MRRRGSLRVGALAAALLLLAAPLRAEEAVPATPYPGPSHAIGGPANGCLSGARSLPLSGPGWDILRPARNRFWGTPTLLAFLHDMGERVEPWGHLRIGDMSQPRGGRMAYGHGSHQNGIDADIFFGLPRRSPGEAERADPATPSLLTADAADIDLTRWDPHQTEVLEIFAKDPRTDRIFVNPAIKRALCRSTGADRDWLRKLRPWPGHDDHFHVRLLCPAGDPDCQPTPAIPPGDGCGIDLAWWFSEEARHPAKPKAPKPKPPLPAACHAILGR